MSDNDNAQPDPQDAAVERIDRAIRSCCDRVHLRPPVSDVRDHRLNGGHRVLLFYSTIRQSYEVEVLRNGHWTLTATPDRTPLAEGSASQTGNCARSLVLHHLDLALQAHLHERGHL